MKKSTTVFSLTIGITTLLLTLILTDAKFAAYARNWPVPQPLPLQIALPRQQEETIRIDTNLVVLNVTVTDSQGRRVSQLKAADFHLEDEGRNCTISHFVAETAPFAAVILIDASASMQQKLSRAKVAAAHFADLMRTDDVVSVISFHDKVEQIQDFSSSHDLDTQDIEAQGETKLYEGLLQGIDALAGRHEQRRAVVLISDGADTKSSVSYQDILKRALAVGVTVYAVDIADDRVRTENLQNSGILKELADKTGGRYLRTPGGIQLQSQLQAVAEELRAQYTVGFYPDKTVSGRATKLQRLKLSVTNPRHIVRTRQGYYPPTN
jgi:Ca-activated chloride channel homolog